jgi:uncharacterized phiE125 gp8 family phage protein
MGLTRVGLVSSQLLTYQEAVGHLRLSDDVGYAQQNLVSALIDAATDHLEQATGRRFLTQSWDLTLDAFPRGRVIELPYPPLQSVTSVTYDSPDVVGAVLSASLYDVDATGWVGRLVLHESDAWPTTRDEANAVRIRFVCGYGERSAVPGSLRAAALLLLGHWYENREATISGTIISDVPLGVDALIAPFRVHRWA